MRVRQTDLDKERRHREQLEEQVNRAREEKEAAVKKEAEVRHSPPMRPHPG
jgi:hypothetical protein